MKTIINTLILIICIGNSIKSETNYPFRDLYRYQKNNIDSLNIYEREKKQKFYLKSAKTRTKMLTSFCNKTMNYLDTIYMIEFLDAICIGCIQGYVWSPTQNIVVNYEIKQKPYEIKHVDWLFFVKSCSKYIFYITQKDDFKLLREDVKKGNQILDGSKVVLLKMIKKENFFKFEICTFNDFSIPKIIYR